MHQDHARRRVPSRAHLAPVPGHLDGWSLVPFSNRTRNPFARTRAASLAPGEGTPPEQAAQSGMARSSAAKGHGSGRGRVVPVVAAATVLVLAGGTAAFARAQKSVTLDVDGRISHVTTFAGSVDGLLDDQGVPLGARDDVSTTGRLTEGAEIVVRHAHQVTVSLDGVEQVVWTTALTADEALDTFASRAGTVALVASRSAAGGRPEMALDLTLHGPADILVDGTVLPAPDADARVAQLLGELGVTLSPLDRVSVRHGENGRVQVVVNRVVVQDVTSTLPVEFASSTQDDPERYTDQRRTLTVGVPGVRTVVETVTTVDGVETSRTPVSDQITQAPVDEVIGVGTKARPVAAKAAPKAASGGTSTTPVTASGDADSLNWAALAACESGGNPGSVSGSGKYFGLYQFSVSTWAAVGGSGLPSDASAEEQTARAKALYDRSGAGQWPHCGPNLFS
ncbi:transglycosylase family protein [Cellulomonas sp. URHB0016]